MKRIEAVDRTVTTASLHEVPSFLAVLAESQPHLNKNRMTYMCLTLSEVPAVVGATMTLDHCV